MADSRLEALGKVPLFSSLSQRRLRKILRGTLDFEYPEGATLVRQGQEGETLYVILEGKARVMRGKRSVARLSAGDFFGEISVLDERPRSANVVAATPMRCMALHRAELRKIVDDDPRVGWEMLRALAGRLRGD